MKRNNVVRALLEISTKNSMSQWKREVCLNAADLIDAQAQEIEALRVGLQAMRNAANGYKKMVPQWVSAKERLPTCREDVLVVAFWHETWQVFIGWCVPEKNRWYVRVSGDLTRRDVTVTHWMPLPEAVKSFESKGD